jgi:phage terminase large subunit GpA-like protein
VNAPLPAGILAEFRAGLEAAAPRPLLTVSQWADAHRVLPTKSSAEGGLPWRTGRNPMLREIMDALSVRSPVRQVTIAKSAQGGGTEVGLNWLGYIIDHAPAPTLVVLPTLEVRKRWTIQRLNPLLQETPTLRDKFAFLDSRNAANTEELKDFPGGLLVVGGANSPASLASMPIAYVLCDELDRFPWQAGNEGDPLGLIRQRQITFQRRKLCVISTPTIEDASRIDEEYAASDRSAYHVPCPHCGEGQALKFDNLRWEKPFLAAWYVCEHCGAHIEESAKAPMLAAGRWVAELPERSRHHRGFHWNQLYNPVGLGPSWTEVARHWLESYEDPVKRKVFVNTVLGRSYADRSREVKPNALQERARDYPLRSAPAGVVLVTAGVDLQDDRLAVQLLGWGAREACWVLDWTELPGVPSKPEVWAALWALLERPVEHAGGRALRVRAVAIDTGGHYTADAYMAVRACPVRGLIAMAVKGSSTPSAHALGRPKMLDFDWRGKAFKRGVQLWLVGTETLKSTLFNRLGADKDAEPERHLVHFSAALPAEYYDQLTSETYDPEKNRWVKRRGRRNEALDTWVYAAAAAHHPYIAVHRKRAADWEALARELERAPALPTAVPESEQSLPQAPGHAPRGLTLEQMIELARRNAAPR